LPSAAAVRSVSTVAPPAASGAGRSPPLRSAGARARAPPCSPAAVLAIDLSLLDQRLDRPLRGRTGCLRFPGCSASANSSDTVSPGRTAWRSATRVRRDRRPQRDARRQNARDSSRRVRPQAGCVRSSSTSRYVARTSTRSLRRRRQDVVSNERVPWSAQCMSSMNSSRPWSAASDCRAARRCRTGAPLFAGRQRARLGRGGRASILFRGASLRSRPRSSPAWRATARGPARAPTRAVPRRAADTAWSLRTRSSPAQEGSRPLGRACAINPGGRVLPTPGSPDSRTRCPRRLPRLVPVLLQLLELGGASGRACRARGRAAGRRGGGTVLRPAAVRTPTAGPRRRAGTAVPLRRVRELVRAEVAQRRSGGSVARTLSAAAADSRIWPRARIP